MVACLSGGRGRARGGPCACGEVRYYEVAPSIPAALPLLAHTATGASFIFTGLLDLWHRYAMAATNSRPQIPATTPPTMRSCVLVNPSGPGTPTSTPFVSYTCATMGRSPHRVAGAAGCAHVRAGADAAQTGSVLRTYALLYSGSDAAAPLVVEKR